ncbi:NrdH-redoxin [Arenimonas sp.]|nr:NrdH-redoxin [Candidatus Parcubacteria bacterium]
MDTITSTEQTNKIIIYSTENCKFCHMLKDYLTEKGFTYENVDVGKDAAQADIAREKSGQLGVPVTDINGSIIVGYDTEEIDKLLNIK